MTPHTLIARRARRRTSCAWGKVGAWFCGAALSFAAACSPEARPDVPATSFDASSPGVSAHLGATEPVGFTDAAPPGTTEPKDVGVAEAGLDAAPSVEGGALEAGRPDAHSDAATSALTYGGHTSHRDVSSHDAGSLLDGGTSSDCDGVAPRYAAGLTATGANGVLVTLVKSEPAPPVVGLNVFHLTIEDDAGNAVSDAQLTVTPYMPQHHHGSPTLSESEELEDGKYRVSRVEFTMPGYWEVTVDVAREEFADSARLKLCL